MALRSCGRAAAQKLEMAGELASELLSTSLRHGDIATGRLRSPLGLRIG
jgi:hypothetical protein